MGVGFYIGILVLIIGLIIVRFHKQLASYAVRDTRKDFYHPFYDKRFLQTIFLVAGLFTIISGWLASGKISPFPLIPGLILIILSKRLASKFEKFYHELRNISEEEAQKGYLVAGLGFIIFGLFLILISVLCRQI